MMPPPPPRRSHMVGVIDKLASFMPKDRPWCGPHPAKFIYRLHKTCIATPGTDERYNNELNILHSPFFTFTDFGCITRGLAVAVSGTKSKRMLTRLKSPRVQVNCFLTTLLSDSLL